MTARSPVPLALALLVAVLVAVAALAAASAPGGAAGAPRPAARPAGCDTSPGERLVAGQLVRVPQGVSPHPAAVLAFHGLHGDGAGLAAYIGLDDVARREHFVVAYPNASHSGSWELHRSRGYDDIRTTRRLIDALVAQLCVDARRVYLTGFSNGASFSARVGCDLTRRVAAIAPVAGSFRSQDPCPVRRGPMPTLEQHGRDPWLGTVPRLMGMTAARNHCRRAPTRRPLAGGAVRTTWRGCALERVFFPRLGHQWPPGASERIWRFLRRHRR